MIRGQGGVGRGMQRVAEVVSAGATGAASLSTLNFAAPLRIGRNNCDGWAVPQEECILTGVERERIP